MAIMILKPKEEAMMASYPAEERFVRKVEYPPEGGILSWFHGERYPEKQLVYPEMFGVLNPIKRGIMNAIRLLKDSHLAKFLLILSVIFPGGKKLRERILIYYADMVWCGLCQVALKPEYLCQSARELRRAALTVVEGSKMKGTWEQIINTICLIWEYDNAYRCRAQDAAGIIDKEKFLERPIKEIKRTFEIYSKRDLILKEKNNLVKWLFLIICLVKKKTAIAFMRELDLEKLKMDVGDRYWTYHRTDYNVDGLDLIDRMRKRSLMRLKK